MSDKVGPEVAGIEAEKKEVEKDGDIVLYGRRWFMLFIGSFSNLCNAILWITFAPITSVASEYYDTSVLGIVMLSLVFLALYIPGSALASGVFQKYGVRNGVLIGAVMNFASGLMRLLSASTQQDNEGTYKGAYVILLLGQCISGLSQPFFTNLPSRFSALWFPVAQRGMATTAFAASNLVGIALGSTIPSFFTFVKEQPTVNATGQTVIEEVDRCDIFALLMTEAVILLIAVLLVYFFFQEKPPTAPSRSQEEMRNLRNGSDKRTVMENFNEVWSEVKVALSNKEFRKIFFAAGIGLGIFNSITTLIETLTKPAGYSVDDASTFSLAFVGMGLVGAIIFGAIMDCTHKYITLLRITASLGSVAMFVLMFSIRPDNADLLTLAFGVAGLAMIPILPISFETGAEATFPLNEDITTGLLMVGGQILGIPYLLIMEALIQEQPEFVDAASFKYEFTPTYMISVISVAFFWVLAMWYNGPYLRLAAEQQDKENKIKQLEDGESDTAKEVADKRKSADEEVNAKLARQAQLSAAVQSADGAPPSREIDDEVLAREHLNVSL